MKLIECLQDPRPEMLDTVRWRLLFLLVAKKQDVWEWSKMETLLRNLWFFRHYGTGLKADLVGLRFVPMIHPLGYWKSEEEFNEAKKSAFTPYANELTKLLQQVDFIDRNGVKTNANGLIEIEEKTVM